MNLLKKGLAMLFIVLIVFSFALPVHHSTASEIEFEYEEEEPKLTQTESQGRDTGFPGDLPGGDIPGVGGGDSDASGFWESLWNWGKEVVQKAGHTVAEFIGDAGASLGEAISAFAPHLGEKIKEYSAYAESMITGLINAESLGEFLESMWKAFKVLNPIGMGVMFGDLIASGLVDAWNAMPDWAQGLLKGLAVGIVVAAVLVGGAYLLAALGVIAVGMIATVAVLAAGGALLATIYGGLVGGDNFNPFVAGGLVLGSVFIPLSGKIAGFLLSTRTAMMLGAKAHVAFAHFSTWIMSGLSSIPQFVVANKAGFLIGGAPAYLQHYLTWLMNPSEFDFATALIDVTASSLTGGLLAPLGSGFAALARGDKLKRVFSAATVGGGFVATTDWVNGGDLSFSSFVTGAVITAVFFPLGIKLASLVNPKFGQSLTSQQTTFKDSLVDFLNGTKQTFFTNGFKSTFINGFDKVGEMISKTWNHFKSENLNHINHLDTDQLQDNIDQKTSDR